ncbi:MULTISPECIES: hypothetical protein [Streptococcus]|uniref:Transcriptional regulator HTH-type FeoC domain-containing protein n=2 Tax=Streptococcus TaxID=1301 RepID=E6J262_STRAP|nr:MULTISPECIES: hypothetical protein [Streptococcus]AIK77548.1 transcriptional regulator [Streptococcus anginosus]ANW85410.1 hypothetical protein SanJ4206_1159c [Streptococcus anginosus]EFU21998.1 hypothetical protein HMPREF0813_01350 [Streptococcus anginosus F0211]ETS97458.1 FeoC-like transcriptional regulator [Streptococcus sp. OBRC6]EUB16008.1 FeoC-like transcriptional regulator [Streptococcus sp. ACC21]
MLIQLLELLKNKRTYTLQELAELTGEDLDGIKMKIEYLENNGYLIKVKKSETEKCTGNCLGCSHCVVNHDDIWIVKE